MESALTSLTLLEQAALLRNGECSSRDIIEAHLARIERLDPKLHAFVEIYGAEARRLAIAADNARAAGFPLAPLHGLPIGLKDLLDIEGRVSTVGSRMWHARRASTTAAVVERLLQAGMIPLGKLHMVEFAFGGWGTNPLMGTPWNPWDMAQHRVPGGSSSGSAVAVAAHLLPAAIGSDTGGSVRVPAAFNGITALKVTCGRISLHGAAMLSWTLDSIGPMARSVADCAALLQALAGEDSRDPATMMQPSLARPDAWPERLQRARIALPEAAQLPSFMSAGVIDAWRRAAGVLAGAGAEIVPTSLPGWFFELSAPASTIIACEAFTLHRDWIDDPAQPIGEIVRARVLNARNFSGADYAQALRQMHDFRRSYLEWSRDYDAVLLPTVAIPAPSVAEIEETSPLPNYLTRPANYLGLCALALPSGMVEGLPAGVQILGKPYDEQKLLRVGRVYERETRFEPLKVA